MAIIANKMENVILTSFELLFPTLRDPHKILLLGRNMWRFIVNIK